MTNQDKKQLEDEKKKIIARIEKVLQSQNYDKLILSNMSIEEMASEVSIYHQELIYQNEELMRQKRETDIAKMEYQALFDEAPIGYVVLDENYRICSVNKTFADMIHSGIYSLKQKALTELIHPDSQDAFYLCMRKLEREGQCELAELKMGSRFYHFKSNLFISTGKKRIRSTFIDITPRKLAEENLVESSARYNLALEGAQTGLWDWDLKDNTIYFSPEFKRILGYEDHEFANKYESWKNLWHPEDEDKIAKTMANYRQGITTKYELSHRLLHKDGEYRWILTRGFAQKDSGGIPSRFIGTIIDITDLTNEREKNEELQHFFDLSQDLMVIASQEGKPYKFNHAWLDILGYRDDEMKSLALPNLIHPEDADLYQDAVRKTTISDRQTRFIARFRCKDTTYRSIEWSVRLFDQKLNGTGRDITERLAIEEARGKERELFNTTLNSVGVAIVVTDGAGKILLMNPLAEHYSNWKKEDAFGKDFDEVFRLLNGETRNRLSGPTRMIRNTKTSTETPPKAILMTEEGAERRISGHANPILAKEGTISAIVVSLRDVTKEYSLEKEIEGFLNVNLDMLTVGGLAGNFVKVNKKFEDVLGYTTQEIEGKNFMEFVHNDDIQRTLDALSGLQADGHLTGFVNRYRCKDGSYKYIEWNSIPGVGQFIYSSARDVTEKMMNEENLKNLATRDELTGLHNRHYFDLQIKDLMEHSDRYDEPLSFILYDLDHFKRVNDSFGHQVGDEVLKTTARVTEKTVRDSDICFRYGGEEFLVLMPQTSLGGAAIAAEKIRAAVENTSFPVIGRQTVSIGVSERMKSESFRHWFKRTDNAMYRAKKSGRNRVEAAEDSKETIAASLPIVWNSEWESGDPYIDCQHQELVEQVNELIDIFLSGASHEEFTDKLDPLLEHITHHFEYEEKVIRDKGYPDYVEHGNIHLHLVAKMSRLKESFVKGEVKPAAFLSFVMDDVILDHLKKDDTKFFPYT